ncbi:MAG: hypothetical protein U0531_12820 [Dehalococcoidia bacterium]
MIERLGNLGRAGIERVMLQHHNQQDYDVLELIARDIMPAVDGA